MFDYTVTSPDFTPLHVHEATDLNTRKNNFDVA
jgi:hypothetical protein